jgi:hypothetical protein
MSHKATAEIIKAYLLPPEKELVLTGEFQYSLVIFGNITIESF